MRSLTYAATGGRAPASPPGVTFPVHWRTAAVDALRRELVAMPEWSADPARLTLISDAAAALSALQAEPGLPTRGVVALCDFGGTGTSITLADAADGYRPIGATVRHVDFSGELIDRALLAHVIADVSVGGTADVAGTAAIGSLHRLRADCRGAKERLSRSAVTTVFADVPGYRGEVRLTRAELDDEIRRPLDGVRRDVARTPVPQPNPFRRPDRDRHRGRRCRYSRGDDGPVGAPGTRDHDAAPGVDGGPRRRDPSEPPT